MATNEILSQFNNPYQQQQQMSNNAPFTQQFSSYLNQNTPQNKTNDVSMYLKPSQQKNSISSAKTNKTDPFFKSDSSNFTLPPISAPNPTNNSNKSDLNRAFGQTSNSESLLDFGNKVAYRQALDLQIAEKERAKLESERARRRDEVDSLSKYPFGRRADNSLPAYRPSFQPGNNDAQPNNQTVKLNKDQIVEKPNSINADFLSYDPIKHRSAFQQENKYDPWGKPGGGAPLVDAKTGHKSTKYSGQIWYDTIGWASANRNQQVTLEEQQRDMESERERKRAENVLYKANAGDLASCIDDLEKQRRAHQTYGAHLSHTNVTREKLNVEYAGRNENSKAYHDELGIQLEERNRQKQLYKLNDQMAGIEHTKKWNDWWGRPGGGAPNTDRRRRDLFQSLQSPRAEASIGTSLPVGSANLPKNLNNLNDAQLLFTKTSGGSNHKNLYDNVQPMKL